MPITHSLRSACAVAYAAFAATACPPSEAPFSVAKIDEDATAVVPVARDPTEEDDFFLLV